MLRQGMKEVCDIQEAWSVSQDYIQLVPKAGEGHRVQELETEGQKI